LLPARSLPSPRTHWRNRRRLRRTASGRSFSYNLRFPGQYYQAETGLNQNWFRDYDPAPGRYVESDPIGLRGGSISTYAYVNNGPILYVDPLGLCWFYVQSTGELLHLDANGFADYFVNGGYSGYGAGVNNPAMQDVQAQQRGDDAGPIPQGSYVIGPLYNNVGSTGPNTMNLDFPPGTTKYIRDLFRIHGDNNAKNHTASDGCIVEKDPQVRKRIARSKDTCLRVVP